MPDILNDDPASFAAQLPDLDNGDSPDFAFHNDARQALWALNRHAFGDRGTPGLTVRSVVEDGAVADGVTDTASRSGPPSMPWPPRVAASPSSRLPMGSSSGGER